MTHDPSHGVPVRTKEVLEHFLQNPNLMQDLEDVARWRLPYSLADLTFDQVRRALLWLVEEKFLVEETGMGSAPRFRLNEDREPDAWQFIADPDWQLYGHADKEEIRRNRFMILAKAWIDATLFRHLNENPSVAGDQPGLTRSLESTKALLSRRRINQGEGIDSARRAVTDAARSLTDALKTADDEPLGILYRTLRLTFPELQAVLLCLAPELDAVYQVIYGVLNDDMSRRTPTLGLICSLLGDSLKVRAAFAASAGLTRWRLIESAGSVLPHGDDPMRLDASLVCWLLGSPTALFSDPAVAHTIRPTVWPGGTWLKTPKDLGMIEELENRFKLQSKNTRTISWMALCGEDSDGWCALVEVAATKANVPLARLIPQSLAIEAGDWNDASIRIVRAVLLLVAIPILDLSSVKSDGEGELDRLLSLAAALTSAERPGIIIAPELERIASIIPREGCDIEYRSSPNTAALANIYSAAMSEVGLYLGASDAAQTALSFPLSLDGIHRAIRLASLNTSSNDTFANQAVALLAACRKVASPDLPRFARRVEPTFSLEDVVLPPDRLQQLREIAAHVKFASHVLNTWGFSGQLPYGRGVAALFSGPSGTGKTMAAQAIARELKTETFVIDLSQVVSKYIGETEKFIDATFRDAQRAGAVLQIDEAEALFGRRSEVKDSHDRYANLEVAYLLQRMEAFDGVAILTTNLRQNVDQAFLRRLRFVIDFPKPDADAREKIWRQCMPKGAPVNAINFRFLARRLELTGGHIRQITVRAAFAAASEKSKAIEMKHVVNATRAELVKLGMFTAERDLAAWEAAQVA
jgi:hypothetical protein